MDEPKRIDLPENWLRDVVAAALREVKTWPKWKQPVNVRKYLANRSTDHD